MTEKKSSEKHSTHAYLQNHKDGLIGIRRLIHSAPEHAYKEQKTAEIIVHQLKLFGFDEIHTGIAGTGVVGVIRGKDFQDGQRWIGLRAEMDCLAMQEETGLEWASKNDGYMHACGHDGHIAILLGAAGYLAKHREFSGAVCVIFQPAEEGGAGAKAMLDDGLLDRFPISAVYALHNAPWITYGYICINHGPMMAAADRIKISITGTGGHGGMPHLGTDSILASAQVIVALQSIVARSIDPTEPAVVSICGLSAGNMNQYSVSPQKVELIGTVRTYSKTTQDSIENLLHKITHNTCEAFGLNGSVEYTRCYPATINHLREANLAIDAGREIYSEERVLIDSKPSTSGEDFAFFLEKVPGAYIWIGQGNEKTVNLHSPYYDFDDRLISRGSSLLIAIVKRELIF